MAQSGDKGCILLVDDSADFRIPLAEGLCRMGYEVLECKFYKDAKETFNQTYTGIDLIIQDIWLDEPDSGYKLIKYYRTKSDAPIMALSAYTDLEYHQRSIDSGANTHVPKDPSFNPMPTIIESEFDRELRAEEFRSHSLSFVPKETSLKSIRDMAAALIVRHRKGSDETISNETRDTVLQVDGLILHGDDRSATWNGKHVALTADAYRIVHSLARYPDHTLSRVQLAEALGPGRMAESNNHIKDHIKRIRKAFIKVDPEFDKIKTVHAQGYKWMK